MSFPLTLPELPLIRPEKSMVCSIPLSEGTNMEMSEKLILECKNSRSNCTDSMKFSPAAGNSMLKLLSVI